MIDVSFFVVECFFGRIYSDFFVENLWVSVSSLGRGVKVCVVMIVVGKFLIIFSCVVFI